MSSSSFAVLPMPLARTQQLANNARIPEEWPYPWEQMPPDGRHFSAHNNSAIAAPDYGVANQVVICTYPIPEGFTAVIRQIMQSFNGSGWIEGSGDVVFDIDVDRPLGATPIVGRPLPDYTNNIFSLGSPTSGPWPIPGGLIVESGDIRMKARTVANVGIGAGNYFCGAIVGWIYPSS